jgi:hypothetical protein
MACNKPAETTTENVAEENVMPDENAMDANAVATPAAMQLNETTWEFTDGGKNMTETIDASGKFVAWTGAEHIDHGTSAMDKEGEICWTAQPTEIGQSMDTTSDKGKKLTVKRVAYMAVPDNVKPK